MPIPIIQTNCCSTYYGYDVPASVLKKFCECIADYEPGIFKIIAEMCGVHFQIPLFKIASLFTEMNLITSPVFEWRNYMSEYRPSFLEERIETHMGEAITRGHIEKESDYIIGRYIEATKNTNMAYHKLDIIREICKYWGIDHDDFYTNITWAERINREDTRECTIIFWETKPVYNREMVREQSKQSIEILIPKVRENAIPLYKNHPFISSQTYLNYSHDPEAWQHSYLDITQENNYIKMYCGIFVSVFRKIMMLQTNIRTSLSVLRHRYQQYNLAGFYTSEEVIRRDITLYYDEYLRREQIN